MNMLMQSGHSRLAATSVMYATALLLAACGGGGGGGSGGSGSGASSAPSPTTTVSFYSPANGATGVAIGTPIIIKLAVADATSSDASSVLWICGGKTVSFTSASSLSSDGTTMTITMTPAVNASSASDVCTYNGGVTTTGPGGSIKTSVGATYTNADTGTAGTPLPSTAAISAYMSSANSIDQISLAADVQALEATLASQGNLCSGDEIIALANLKEMHVQTFLKKVTAYIQLEKTTNAIDKSAIARIFLTYQSQDLAWMSAPSPSGCGFSDAEISATGYALDIYSYYANAIAELNAM